MEVEEEKKGGRTAEKSGRRMQERRDKERWKAGMKTEWMIGDGWREGSKKNDWGVKCRKGGSREKRKKG